MSDRVRKLTTDVAGFLAWENRQKRRYELVGTEIRLMAGGPAAHDLISLSIASLLGSHFRQRGCNTHGSNLKVVSPLDVVTYPDAFVRCGPLGDDATECDDPIIVVEVISTSTRGDDLICKRMAYQAIPSLRYFVYVDAAKVQAEVAAREAPQVWRSVILTGIDEAIELPGFEAVLRLAEVYRGTSLAAP